MEEKKTTKDLLIDILRQVAWLSREVNDLSHLDLYSRFETIDKYNLTIRTDLKYLTGIYEDLKLEINKRKSSSILDRIEDKLETLATCNCIKNLE